MDCSHNGTEDGRQGERHTSIAVSANDSRHKAICPPSDARPRIFQAARRELGEDDTLAARRPASDTPRMRTRMGNSRPTISLLVLVALTFGIGFWASTLPPAPQVADLGAWSYSVDSDPIATTRLSLIIAGLLAPLVAAVAAVRYNPRDKRDLLPLTLVAACVTACFAFGWRNIPYWANGVYRTDLGEFEYLDMDPKALPPMIWIGEFWRLPVALFPIALLVMTAAVFPLVGWAWMHERARIRPLLAIFTVGVAWVPMFWRVDNYFGWLLD